MKKKYEIKLVVCPDCGKIISLDELRKWLEQAENLENLNEVM